MIFNNKKEQTTKAYLYASLKKKKKKLYPKSMHNLYKILGKIVKWKGKNQVLVLA